MMKQENQITIYETEDGPSTRYACSGSPLRSEKAGVGRD